MRTIHWPGAPSWVEPAPPNLFGQEFNFTDAPNRYGLPPFYSLHAWVWKDNPAGAFAMWNPTCIATRASEGVER
jgi:hypothetical protein